MGHYHRVSDHIDVHHASTPREIAGFHRVGEDIALPVGHRKPVDSTQQGFQECHQSSLFVDGRSLLTEKNNANVGRDGLYLWWASRKSKGFAKDFKTATAPRRVNMPPNFSESESKSAG
jgi:hypothetical protein